MTVKDDAALVVIVIRPVIKDVDEVLDVAGVVPTFLVPDDALDVQQRRGLVHLRIEEGEAVLAWGRSDAAAARGAFAQEAAAAASSQAKHTTKETIEIEQ